MQRDENHPRPQLARAHWVDLSGPWGFAYDDADVGCDEGWMDRADCFDRTCIVPFPPESRASGIGDPAFHPIVWYRRTFRRPPTDAWRRLVVYFGAVDYRAQVWVNGHLVAEHEGGMTPFRADITTALLPGDADQVIVVRAEDDPSDLAQPRGKQYWEVEPRRIWYHRTTGIWQPVWLEPVAPVHIVDIRWTPDLDRGLLGMQILLNQAPPHTLRLRARFSLDDVTLADDTYEVQRPELRRSVALEPARLTMGRETLLWSPGAPNLIDVELTLLDGDTPIDEMLSYAGIRSVGIANGRFLLNGRPYYLRLALEQGYWPESHLAAPSNAALRREVELARALGFNGLRIHQKVEDPRFLYWCDRLGLLIWGEMANAYVYSRVAVERLTREWMDVVRRDYSHPCVVMWVPLNESWGVPGLDRDPAEQHYVQALYHLTHALDPTRPCIGNDGWEHISSDVLGIHDYALDGATITHRYGSPEAVERTLHEVQPAFRALLLPGAHPEGEPVMLTEFGGISYAPMPGQRWFGYGTVTGTDAFLAKYADIVGAILACPTVVGFCYTQLTDTEQETNGLLLEDRSPKLDPNAIRAINRQPSAAMPGEVLASVQAVTEVTTFQGGGGASGGVATEEAANPV